MGRLEKTVYDRDKASYLSMLVHDEWLGTVMTGHDERYQEWNNFAAWLIVQCLVPSQQS